MPVPPAFLACPECGSAALEFRTDLSPAPAPFDSEQGLSCKGCERVYPHVDGVWVMWSDTLRRLQFEGVDDLEALADEAERVKRANIAIYDQVSDSYGEHNDGSRSYSDTVLFLRALAESDASSDPKAGFGRILVDVGCATGNSMQIGTSGFDAVVGVDISLANLRHVAEKGFVAVLADAAALPFAKGSIDIVTIYAALHHLPDPEVFASSAHRALKPGGALLIGCEPSHNAMNHRFLGKLVWEGRKPVYRALSKVSSRFYLHTDTQTQRLNDLAEHQRTHGGFTPASLEGLLQSAGFDRSNVFYDLDHRDRQRFRAPGWKMAVLKGLSLQNPVRIHNTANLSAVGVKAPESRARGD